MEALSSIVRAPIALASSRACSNQCSASDGVPSGSRSSAHPRAKVERYTFDSPQSRAEVRPAAASRRASPNRPTEARAIDNAPRLAL